MTNAEILISYHALTAAVQAAASAHGMQSIAFHDVFVKCCDIRALLYARGLEGEAGITCWNSYD